MDQSLGILEGFGSRLREERARIGWSQEALATLGGVKRLTQIQYEKGVSSPTVRYLALLTSAGIDLEYLLFGRRLEISSLLSVEKVRIERQAFEQLEDFVHNLPDVQYGAEVRFVLFQMLRANLTAIACQAPAKLEAMQ